MSNNQTNAHSFTLDGFGGVDLRSYHTDPTCAQEICNFRVRSDGSLEKRYGGRFLKKIGTSRPHAYWVGRIKGRSLAYFFTDSTLLCVDLESLEETVIASLTFQNNAFFFFYEGMLYLCNDKSLYLVRNNGISAVEGYAPLIGKDWNNRTVGPEHEPKNILTKRVRISYVISSPASTFLSVPEKVLTIDNVFVNDVRISPERYYWDDQFGTVNVLELSAGDRVMIYVTLDIPDYEERNALATACRAVSFGKNTSNRLFFIDREGASEMLCSSYVSKSNRVESERGYPSCGALYLPEGKIFGVGNRSAAIQSAEHHREHLMLFTEEDAWMADAEVSADDEFPTFCINSTVGTSEPLASTVVENEIFTFSQGGVWQWSGRGDTMNDMSAVRISLPIDPHLKTSNCTGARLYYNRFERELWLHLPRMPHVWIYQLDQKLWYRFTANADFFFDSDLGFGYMKGALLFLYDPTMFFDTVNDKGSTSTIAASYLGGFFNFDSAKPKILEELVLDGDFQMNVFKVRAADEHGDTYLDLQLSDQIGHTRIKRRLSSPRFFYAALQITCSDSMPLTIHRVALRAR